MKASKRDLFKVWIFAFFVLAGLWSFSSCQEIKKPSFIIIASDQLSFNSFACDEDKYNKNSGLNVLCQESIRFTNAFTTSTQSAAAMGSLLSGTYPFQNSLHRSFDRIKPEQTLIQELFKKNAYRTSFFSGKPTILKKTGLSRGFDYFDDSSFLSQPMYSLSFKEQLRLFQNWQQESADPFFSVLYTSELESLNEGETQLSGLENFDETLGQFFLMLKNNNLWESNYIIVTGLQGKSEYSRPNESRFSNLHSENTNVALFIKPPRQKGDEGINWKIDTSISLADFAYSLMKTIVPTYTTTQHQEFPILDFSAFWSKNEIENLPDKSRKIIIESCNTWKNNLEIRFGLIFKNYLFLESETDQLYNKLTDGLETIDLIKNQQEIKDEDIRHLNEIRREIKAKKWVQYQPPIYDWVLSNRAYWSKPNSRADVFQNEKLRLAAQKKSQPLSTLLIYFQNPKLEKDALYEEARRQSYNLSLENIWGLWSGSDKKEGPRN
jgi:hypothetical protein